MAKDNSGMHLSGNANNRNYYRNKYGSFSRAKRGTYKEAVLNDTMADSGGVQRMASSIAKPIYRALKKYMTDFEDGELWNRLVGRIAKPAREQNRFDFFNVENLDFHASYPMSNLVLPKVECIDTASKRTIGIRISLDSPLPIEGYAKANAWHPVVVTVFYDFLLRKAELVENDIPVIPMTAKYFETEIARPHAPHQFAFILLKLYAHGHDRGRDVASLKGMGMELLKVIQFGKVDLSVPAEPPKKHSVKKKEEKPAGLELAAKPVMKKKKQIGLKKNTSRKRS